MSSSQPLPPLRQISSVCTLSQLVSAIPGAKQFLPIGKAYINKGHVPPREKNIKFRDQII